MVGSVPFSSVYTIISQEIPLHFFSPHSFSHPLRPSISSPSTIYLFLPSAIPSSFLHSFPQFPNLPALLSPRLYHPLLHHSALFLSTLSSINLPSPSPPQIPQTKIDQIICRLIKANKRVYSDFRLIPKYPFLTPRILILPKNILYFEP